MNSEYVGAFVTGYEPTGGTCTITESQSGTDTPQIFTTDNEKEDEKELKWRIWDYDGTTLRIILDEPTTQKLTLKGVIGYNNGVWAINEICRKCFGQYEEDGITMKKGISVSNLRRSDIQKVSTYDFTQYSHIQNEWKELTEETEGIIIKFGEAKTYKNNNNYPKLWGDNDQYWTYEYKEGKISRSR